MREFFAKANGELEQMLQDTSRLLAGLTQYAAVVVGPPHEAATIRSVQLVGLAPRVALVVVVLSNGVIEKHTIELDADVDELRLVEAGAALADLLIGETLSAVPLVDAARLVPGPAGPAPATSTSSAVIAARALQAIVTAQHQDEQVFIGGASRMASAFDAVAQVSEILQILEQQFVVVTLLRDLLDRGLNVAIGTETGIQPLAECSVIVSPYTVDGEPAGSIGVLGPTRMNYPQALAAVAVVSQRLGHRLSEG